MLKFSVVQLPGLGKHSVLRWWESESKRKVCPPVASGTNATVFFFEHNISVIILIKPPAKAFSLDTEYAAVVVKP